MLAAFCCVCVCVMRHLREALALSVEALERHMTHERTAEGVIDDIIHEGDADGGRAEARHLEGTPCDIER